MSTFIVKVRTESGHAENFEEQGHTSAEVHEAVSAHFGHLCRVVVFPK